MAESAELFSLKEQLKNRQNSLLLIQEKKSEYVSPTDVPIQLIDNERKTEAEIARLKELIAALGGSEPLDSQPIGEATPVPESTTEQTFTASPAPVRESTHTIDVPPASTTEQTSDTPPVQPPTPPDKTVLITVLQILVPTIGTIVVAYFGWRGIVDPIRNPIEATRAAETIIVKATPLAQKPSPSPTVLPTKAPATSGLGTSETEAPFFDTFAADGKPDETKWQVADGDGFCEVHQQDDMLVFSMRANEPIQGRKNCFLDSQKQVMGNRLRLFEARMKLQGDFEGKSNIIQLVLASRGFVGGGWIACGLAGHQGEEKAVLSIYTNDGSVEEYYASRPIELNTWYTIRAEIDSAMGVSCYVDEHAIGQRVVPKDSESLKSALFERFVQVTLVEGTSAISYIDYVKMNP